MSTKSPQKIPVKIKFLSSILHSLNLDYATSFSAGLDLRACFKENQLTFKPRERKKIPTGIAIEILEPSIAGFVFSRSGLGTKQGLVITQGVGVIDPDYRGEIFVSLLNISEEDQTIIQGERIAQLIFLPFFQAQIIPTDNLSYSTRGNGGFGHTGKL
ncbi:dUTP pyrophosphatase [Desulfonauticus submarinus]|uniref:dUTP diphosphatase n=1 Tax=Desulfonauticus submarinus TaxID=206665 RepID=A0A1H0BU97_9BACT|nr:dUTP diphosphatase [Desulfonauticus submarinus]SDN49175.1 dUTP pyrophosphatase [Desulfonauticus submarinus]